MAEHAPCPTPRLQLSDVRREELREDAFAHMAERRHNCCGSMVVLDGNCGLQRSRCSCIINEQLELPGGVRDPDATFVAKYCRNTPARGDSLHRCQACIDLGRTPPTDRPPRGMCGAAARCGMCRCCARPQHAASSCAAAAAPVVLVLQHRQATVLKHQRV